MIRQTKRGRFEVSADPTVARWHPVCVDTLAEAEALETRPVPPWLIEEHEYVERTRPYYEQYAAVLASPRMRELRASIQDAYGEWCEAARLAWDAQRAAVRGFGQISCTGRDVGAVRQGCADEKYSEVDELGKLYYGRCAEYERELTVAMTEAEIPLEVRTGGTRSWHRSAKEVSA